MSVDDIELEHINGDLVRALHAKVKELESEVTRLQDRVDELESGAGSATATTANDPYDAAVLDRLEFDQTVTTPELTNLYIDETKIMNKKKAKRRAKSLRNGSEFEALGYGEYRYVGGESDE